MLHLPQVRNQQLVLKWTFWECTRSNLLVALMFGDIAYEYLNTLTENLTWHNAPASRTETPTLFI